MPDHLLPPNSTAQERALSATTDRIDALPVPIRHLWNPETCPAEHLPWLAWALSVDGWDEAWSEKQKREAIRAAVWIHRHKGTRGALNRAINTLGYNVAIREWWEQAPKGEPYTFEVDVEVDDRGVEAGVFSSMTNIVNSAKNERSHLTRLNVIGRSNGSIFSHATSMGADTVTIYPYSISKAHVAGGLNVGGTTACYETIHVHPRQF